MTIRLRDTEEWRGGLRRMGSITFSRAGLGGVGAVMMAAFVLSGCAPARAPVLSPPQAAATGPDYATVAAIRPIPGTGGGGIDPQAEILAAMGLSPGAEGAGGARSEIILRRDDGETLSMVEPNADGLSPGERVTVRPGGSGWRLAPAPPAR